MAEQALVDLREHPNWTLRSFSAIQRRVGVTEGRPTQVELHPSPSVDALGRHGRRWVCGPPDGRGPGIGGNLFNFSHRTLSHLGLNPGLL